MHEEILFYNRGHDSPRRNVKIDKEENRVGSGSCFSRGVGIPKLQK